MPHLSRCPLLKTFRIFGIFVVLMSIDSYRLIAQEDTEQQVEAPAIAKHADEVTIVIFPCPPIPTLPPPRCDPCW